MKKNIFIALCLLSSFSSFAVNPFVDYNVNASARSFSVEKKVKNEKKPVKTIHACNMQVFQKQLDDGRILTYDGKDVKINGIFKFKIIDQGVRAQLLKDAISGIKSMDYKPSNIHGINQRLRNLFLEVSVDDNRVKLSTISIKDDPLVSVSIIETIKSSVPEFMVDKKYLISGHMVSINSNVQVVVDDVAYDIITNSDDRMVALARMLTIGKSVDWIDIAPLGTSAIFDDNYRYKWIQLFKDCIMNSPLKIETISGCASYKLAVS